MVDLAVMIIAVAVVVLVGYMVPTILQVKRTVGQSERLLIRLNHELPGLLKEVKGTNDNIRALTDELRGGVDRATIFLNAVGEVGHTVHQVHQAVRGKGGTVMIGLTSLLAGIKAATSTVKHRVHKESKEKQGGSDYGE
ncbi:MAG: DUF948 domain-containing protein [Nitrospirota bacterium]|nr:DUF948 domain-containing protein [Nitrospirota bacterium]